MKKYLLFTALFIVANSASGDIKQGFWGVSSINSLSGAITLAAGTNVTITPSGNTLTISSAGGTGGGGGGIVRVVASTSANTTAGATALTDYVYFVSSSPTITMPTAVGNSNRYTIKNVGVGTVTIGTTSAQTIDGSSTITLPVRYTSVELVSNNANWDIL